jgi:hypothetical protein
MRPLTLAELNAIFSPLAPTCPAHAPHPTADLDYHYHRHRSADRHQGARQADGKGTGTVPGAGPHWPRNLSSERHCQRRI